MLKLLEIRSQDPDLHRKGQVLSVMLLSMVTAMLVVVALNTVEGQLQYNVSNGALLVFILGLFVLNRWGFVYPAGLLTVLLTTVAPLLLLKDSLPALYITMPLPILVASSLLVPWAGFAVAAGILLIVVSLGGGSLALLLLGILAIFAYLFSSSLERAYQDIRYRAFHDSLTGLPNRALFLDNLEQISARPDQDLVSTAVLFMDLDNFKIINESLGHELGDRLLVQAGRRISECLRPGDVAARMGGDEFTVLLDSLGDMNDAIQVTERIERALQKPFKIGEHEVTASVSIGIAWSRPGHFEPAGLLRDADVAMYQAKRSRETYRVFHSSMHDRALKRLELEGDLRRAIEEDDFTVYYQPKVHLGTGRVVGVEALVRWGSPETGVTMPSEFIPVAEETGLIIPIGEQVLEGACRQLREWRESYGLQGYMSVSVNLSGRQFQKPDLVDSIRRILRETGLEARCLQLEITESVVMGEDEQAIEILEELREIGVQIAIDDFGKGYSSLNYLKELPVDALKIDKSFVDGLWRDVADAAIIRLIVDLAHTLRLEVTAEGVESPEQLARLTQMGCDLGQGYYFSKPLPGDEAGKLIAANPSW